MREYIGLYRDEREKTEQLSMSGLRKGRYK